MVISILKKHTILLSPLLLTIMTNQSSFTFITTFLVIVGFLSLIIKKWKKVNTTPNRLPPGPSLLHLICSLHYFILSFPLHYFLRDLANIYGPLMHVKAGEFSLVVASSAYMAKKVLKTHDLACANRPRSLSTQITSYDYSDIVFSPYGEYWRQMRRICMLELLSAKKVWSFEHIRADEASALVKSIRSSSGVPFNLTEKVFMFMNLMTSRAAFGDVVMDRVTTNELMKKAIALVGQFLVADLFPVFHYISLSKFKLLKVRAELGIIIDNIIDQHRKKWTLPQKGNRELVTEDLVDVLLRLKESGEIGIPITNDNIKAVIFDIFSAGTEASSTTVDWAMAELMKNPRVMAKAQNEVRKAFNGRKMVQESEIRTLKYLKLVIKETLRLHPQTTLIPRACREEFEIDGYHIPLNTFVIINVWAIGRDQNYWANPESFEPERFEEKPINFLGNHFEYVPFGSGKRICPGITFSSASMEFLLAQLLYHFDWKLPCGISTDGLDMTEAGTCRKGSLHLIAIPYTPAFEDGDI